MTELRGEHVTLRPLRPGDAPALRAALATPEVARWWGPQGAGFPFTDDEAAKVERFTITNDGEVAGLIQFGEERDDDNRHADIDIYLDPRFHGRGLGTDAVATLAAHLIGDRGHHRVTLWPDAENEVAIRAYEKAGFRRVGVTEASYRNPVMGEWRDELLMERVVRPRGRASA